MQHKLQEVFYSILVRVSHLGEALHNKQCWMYTAKAAYQTPEPLNRKAHLLRFNRLATVTGKSSTWESTWYPVAKDLALCESSYTRTQPWFKLWHSLFYHLKWSPVELYMGISLEPLTQRSQIWVLQRVYGVVLRERERGLQRTLQEVFYFILVRASHQWEALHNKRIEPQTLWADKYRCGYRYRKVNLLQFNHLAIADLLKLEFLAEEKLKFWNNFARNVQKILKKSHIMCTGSKHVKMVEKHDFSGLVVNITRFCANSAKFCVVTQPHDCGI